MGSNSISQINGDIVQLPDARRAQVEPRNAALPPPPRRRPPGTQRRKRRLNLRRLAVASCDRDRLGLHQTILAIRDVPLLIEDRDAAALELRAARINVFFVYAPPLDEYSGPEFCEPTPLPRAARWWATHIPPIDPHDVERALDLVRKNQIRLMPAAPLPV